MFTARHPFTTDAYEKGFTVGYREDTSGFQAEQYRNVDLPVGFLDNDFRDPDLDRYLSVLDDLEEPPAIAVLGDAYDYFDAVELQDAAKVLRETYPETEPVIAPKCRDALAAIEQDTVLGYANGYSDITPPDFSDIHDWRRRRVHILGGMPPSQYEIVDALTCPTLDQAPPADIVSVDGNAIFKTAIHGEYWDPDGYHDAGWRDLRERVQASLDGVKRFWMGKGLWPETTPIEEHGPAVAEPDDPVYATGDDIRTEDQLWNSIVEQYGDGSVRAYASETEQRFIEHREGLKPAKSLYNGQTISRE
ncbi:hypothetical protein G3I44_14240 [Halogeometricum borinquense]|uniref:Uncharacterized protein n=1 Tax=Halogeometricum borinquense TaxID=60847 RepID=A0A6C0UIS7_9EURY|nr:DUF6610 family protein [Halogeometricum borinquense]QIB75345.1 hypothetical protein G3I44_14240 [Halogeometricum borinquense]